MLIIARTIYLSPTSILCEENNKFSRITLLNNYYFKMYET